MTALSTTARVAVVALALIGPPAVTYALSSLIPQQGLDIFSVLFIEALGFAFAVTMLRPRLWSAALTAALYFPVMFAVIFSIGVRAGYYDWP